MQILQQENIDLPRKVSDTISVTQIPDLVRTCGFYPSEYELENMMTDIKYKYYEETQIINQEVSFIDFLKLFCNHKPVYGYSRHEIEEAFHTLMFNAEDYVPGGISREEFIEVLSTTGENMPVQVLLKCFKTLMRNTDEQTDESFDFMPEVIQYKDLFENILGVDIDRDRIDNEEESLDDSVDTLSEVA
ncbi:unnamed protein product [Acanthoscelides obtectus]|nr:unnamed protein product [Acanthoscelides obtectus]CAK1686763.1 Cilia- and flagella-associated protein 251 [Acanthoscelides obtectus]